MLMVLCIMLTDSITIKDVYVEPNPTGGVSVLFKDGTRKDLDEYESIELSDDRQEIKEEHRSALKEKAVSAKAPEPIVIKSKGNQKRPPISKEQIAENQAAQRQDLKKDEQAQYREKSQVEDWLPFWYREERRIEEQLKEVERQLEILEELQEQADEATKIFDKLIAEGVFDW